MTQAARQQYVAAISKVNEALSRPSGPTEDSVVMSVMMLSMFEVSLGLGHTLSLSG